jgi:hypothetical protein
MGRKKAKADYRRIVLRLPDLDHSKMAELNSLTSPASRRVYKYAIEKFEAWYCSEPRIAFNRIVVVRYRIHLESLCLAANTINQHLAAVRRLAHDAADAGLLSPDLASGIARVKGVSNWVSVPATGSLRTRAQMCSGDCVARVYEPRGTMPCWQCCSVVDSGAPNLLA